jgi:hypothetical protein
MRKALLVAGTALGLGAVAAVGGYFGLQRYLDWLIAGAKRPLAGVPGKPVAARGSLPPGLGTRGPGE